MNKFIFFSLLIYFFSIVVYNIFNVGQPLSKTIIYEENDINNNLQIFNIDTTNKHKILQKEDKKVSNKKRYVHSVKKYSISESGKNFIKSLENCSLVAYPDGDGFSIGYGHHNKNIYEGQVITQEEAEQFFREDIENVTKSVNRLLSKIDYEFPQEFIDGFFSLVYNCGETGLKETDFYNMLSTKCRWYSKDINIIKKDILYTLTFVKTTKTKQGKLIKRRNKEYQLMSNL